MSNQSQSGPARWNKPDRPKSRNYAYLRRTYTFMRPYARQLVYFAIALAVTSMAT